MSRKRTGTASNEQPAAWQAKAVKVVVIESQAKKSPHGGGLFFSHGALIRQLMSV